MVIEKTGSQSISRQNRDKFSEFDGSRRNLDGTTSKYPNNHNIIKYFRYSFGAKTWVKSPEFEPIG